MKQKIHFLFMLLLMIIGGAGGHAFAATTYKLQKVTSVEAGGLYVFEQAGHVAINTVSSSALQTVDEYKTTGLTGSENYVWELKKGTNGFKISSKAIVSNIIANTSKGNVSLNSEGSDWTFTFQKDETVLIQNPNNDNRFLGYSGETSYQYKAYAYSNLSSYPHAIVVYKLVEESSLPSAGLAFAEDSYTATIGETFTTPTLTNPHSLPVSYASSKETVATVNAETGAVTLVGAGTTTITASFAGNDTYAAGEASYELTVSKAPLVVNPKNVNSNYFVKVTDVTELEDGDAILIVNEDAKKAMGTTQNTNNRAASDVIIANYAIEAPGDVQQLILVKEENNFYFYTGEKGFLYAASSSSNNLKTQTDVDDNSKAAISFNDGNATVTFQGSNTRNLLKYNSSNTLFSCYASGQQDVQIYKEVVKPVVAVEAPTFSVEEGTYYEPQSVELACVTEDATIKYSTDGETWSDYTSAITISETTTLYAKAVKGEDESAEVSATYTIAPTYANNQAANVAATSTETDVRLTITNAIVVYKNGQNTYLKDDTGGFLVYGSNNLNVGDKVTGHVDGKLSLYSGLPEIKEPTFSVETVSSDNEVAPIVVDAATLKANPMNYISQYVQVKPAAFAASEFTNKNVNITVGETELVVRNNFNIKASFNTESSYVVAGFVTIYNDAVQLYPTKAGDIVEIPMVAKIGDVKYETLDDAVAAVPDNGAEPTLITLLCDVENGNGIKTVAANPKNVVIDFDGHTYRVGKGLVGSPTTENQSWHLEKGSKFELKNGTLTSSLAAMLIQNYCDLTLTDMQVGSADDSYNYVVSNNCGSLNVNGSTSITAPAGKTAFDVCATTHYPEGVTVTINTTGTITGAIEYDIWTGKPEDNKAKLDIQAGNFNISWKVEDALAEDAKKNLNVYGGTFNVPVPADYCAEGYIPADLGEGKYGVKRYISAPIIFHDEGTYEDALTVAMAGEGTIKYTLNGGTEQKTYTEPITIDATTTVKAWTEQDGVKSDVVTREYKIVEKAKSAVVEDGYYTIQTNDDDGKYVNVAGRKTVTLVSDTKSAGTVIRVKADEEGVKVLRSQAVDLPRYAERAMSYVPEIVKEVVKKLAANVDDPIIGEQGADLILDKFNNEFDYHLYLEGENNTYRIYGRTPSMKPVVDFYAENKELVDSRLPKVEKFVKEVLQEIVNKVGRGQSVVDMFKVKTIWQNMGGKLTDPDVDQAKFFEEVLSSEKNTWEFAYQTGMLYWEKVKGYLTDNISELGDYGKYIEKIPQIRPNFRYYIVPGENGVDIISEGNSQITDASTAWTLTKREGFDVTFDATLSKNNGKEMYKTLYVDFAYELPENVKALKVESVSDAGVAVTKEITGVVPAQTPVLLMSTDVENLTKTLSLSTTDGTAVTNELKGNDWLINEFEINTPQLETIFALLTKLSSSLGEKYEYLKRKNSGTVNNKYFFGLSVPTEEGKFKEAFMNGKIKVLTNGEKGLGFYSNFDKNLVGNEVFMFSEDTNPILLTLKGDVNRDGDVTIADVTALVNIILGKATEGDTHNYDFEAAHVNADEEITIADVTALVNIILGK